MEFELIKSKIISTHKYFKFVLVPGPNLAGVRREQSSPLGTNASLRLAVACMQRGV